MAELRGGQAGEGAGLVLPLRRTGRHRSDSQPKESRPLERDAPCRDRDGRSRSSRGSAAQRRAVAIVHEQAGSTASFDGNALERRFRDEQVVRQHLLLSRRAGSCSNTLKSFDNARGLASALRRTPEVMALDAALESWSAHATAAGATLLRLETGLLTRDQLLDPEQCRSCRPRHYEEARSLLPKDLRCPPD